MWLVGRVYHDDYGKGNVTMWDGRDTEHTVTVLWERSTEAEGPVPKEVSYRYSELCHAGIKTFLPAVDEIDFLDKQLPLVLPHMRTHMHTCTYACTGVDRGGADVA